MSDRQTIANRQADRQLQTDRQTDRQTIANRQTDRYRLNRCQDKTEWQAAGRQVQTWANVKTESQKNKTTNTHAEWINNLEIKRMTWQTVQLYNLLHIILTRNCGSLTILASPDTTLMNLWSLMWTKHSLICSLLSLPLLAKGPSNGNWKDWTYKLHY
jgi:hypothetical protein